MIKHTGIPFIMSDFLLALQAIGRRLEPPDDENGGVLLIVGYFVDGNYVSVGRLQHYLKHFGGHSLELIFERR